MIILAVSSVLPYILVWIQSSQPAKCAPKKLSGSAHFRKYVSDVTCVGSGCLGIPHCLSPRSVGEQQQVLTQEVL